MKDDRVIAILREAKTNSMPFSSAVYWPTASCLRCADCAHEMLVAFAASRTGRDFSGFIAWFLWRSVYRWPDTPKRSET